MFSVQRQAPRRRLFVRAAAITVAGLALAAGAGAAGAQELRQQFINPSFGGNPFYSDHLIATANIHRPESPDVGTAGLSQQDLLVRQIQSRLLSALSSGLIEAVTGADPGTTGEFVIGDQRITFERTLTEIRLTFFNETTGETTEIVLPVISLDPAGTGSTTAVASNSPEAALGSLGIANSGGQLSITTPGASLDGAPVEPPVGQGGIN